MDIPEIIPKEWGPSAWSFMHYTALKYPMNPMEEDKKHYFIFYHNLQFILPCTRCADHYQKNLLELPIQPALENNKTLFKWTVDMHNRVNKDLGKAEVTHEDALNMYINSDIQSSYDIYIKLSVGIIIVLVIYFMNKKYNFFSRFN